MALKVFLPAEEVNPLQQPAGGKVQIALANLRGYGEEIE